MQEFQLPPEPSPSGGSGPPPSPRGWPGAPLLAARRDPLAYLQRLAREHGDVVRVRFGPARLWLLSHPELVKDVLVTHHRRFRGLAFEAGKRVIGNGLLTAQGDAHRRQRRLVQPAFHRDRMSAYGDVMAAHARRWRDARHPGERLPLRAAMVELTLGIVGETMFGADQADAIDDVQALVDTGMRLYGPLTLPVARWLEHLPLPVARRFVRARARLDARVAALLAGRRAEAAAGEAERDDLLAMLLAAREAARADGADVPPLDPDGARTLDDAWVRDEVMTIFLAGHETTASALTWAWWLLARHPEVEARLHAELDAVLGTGEAAPGPADIAALPYARAVFAEALRLWPTVPMVFRRVVEPHEVATAGGRWTLPRGDVVVLSPWVVQRDPRWWPEPDAFRPERWLTPAPERPRQAWFPFGGGARVCVGEHFALLEGALVLATVAQRWRLEADGEGARPAAAALNPLAGTRPPDDWRLRVRPRAASHRAGAQE
jgi:cytochrome P450